MARPTLALVAMMALAGCNLAPSYHPPLATAPLAFKEAGPWIAAAPADHGQRADWWAIYGDARLDALEKRIDTDNPTLAGALGRYDAARAYLSLARADLLPRVGIGADVTRNRQSDNRPLRGANQLDLYDADTVGGNAGFELDLWGRVRNTVVQGRAEAEASADDLAAVKLSLQGELAIAYLALRGYDQQIALLAATVDAFAKADRMTQRRFVGGIASSIDTGRSGAQLGEAEAQLADTRAARALTEHAIASLVGTPASQFTLAVATEDIPLPAIPQLLPSTLLQRRPDVAAAERRMFAANAAIGVARAAFYPSISLGGQAGFQNTGLPSLLTAPNIFWSIGPGAVLNLFDGGRRRAQLNVARANWTQATAAYRDKVLQAFREVEDNLAQLHHLGDEAVFEQRAATQAGQVEALSLNRYAKGADSYLDVVTAQTTALRVRRSVIDLRIRQLQASARLMRALGGGWDGGSPTSHAIAATRPIGSVAGTQ